MKGVAERRFRCSVANDRGPCFPLRSTFRIRHRTARALKEAGDHPGGRPGKGLIHG